LSLSFLGENSSTTPVPCEGGGTLAVRSLQKPQLASGEVLLVTGRNAYKKVGHITRNGELDERGEDEGGA